MVLVVLVVLVRSVPAGTLAKVVPSWPLLPVSPFSPAGPCGPTGSGQAAGPPPALDSLFTSSNRKPLLSSPLAVLVAVLLSRHMSRSLGDGSFCSPNR